MSFTPRLEIYPDRIEHNARTIVSLCRDARHLRSRGHKSGVCSSSSCACAVNAGVDMLADSRLENLQAIRELNVSLPLMLLRIPAQDRIKEVVDLFRYFPKLLS